MQELKDLLTTQKMFSHGRLDDEFIALFNGKFDVSLRGYTYLKTHKWLHEGSGLEKVNTCVVFFSKPLVYLATGQTKKGKGDGKPVSEKLMNFLPMLTGEEQQTVTNSLRLKTAYKAVNFTQVRNTALIYLQYGPSEGLVLQWMRKHGGRPLALDEGILMDSEDPTERILGAAIAAFRSDQPVWGALDWSKAFA
jgi:hypothetical protein